MGMYVGWRVNLIVYLVGFLCRFEIFLREADVGLIFIEIWVRLSAGTWVGFICRASPSPKLPSSLSISSPKSSSPLECPLIKSSSESIVVGGGVLSTADGFVFARLLVGWTSSFCRSAGAFLFLVEEGVVIAGRANSVDLVYHEITHEFQGS